MKALILVLSFVVLSSCSNVSFQEFDKSKSLMFKNINIISKTKKEIIKRQIQKYDLLKGNNEKAYLVYLKSNKLIATNIKISQNLDLVFEEEEILSIPKISRISNLDLDISPNGKHLMLAYIQESTLKNNLSKQLCYVSKDITDPYFSDPTCFNFTANKINEGKEKPIACISNSSTISAFTYFKFGYAYIENRDGQNKFFLSKLKKQGIASMDMNKTTGTTVVAVQEQGEKLKLFIYKTDSVIQYNLENNRYMQNKFQGMNLAVSDNKNESLQILLANFGENGGSLLELKEERNTFVKREHLKKILYSLNIIDMTILIKNDEFVIPVLLRTNNVFESKKELKISKLKLRYKKGSWLIPEKLLVSEYNSSLSGYTELKREPNKS